MVNEPGEEVFQKEGRMRRAKSPGCSLGKPTVKGAGKEDKLSKEIEQKVRDASRICRVQCHQRERNFQDVIMVVSNAAEASRDEDCKMMIRFNSLEVVYDLSEKSSSTEVYETI